MLAWPAESLLHDAGLCYFGLGEGLVLTTLEFVALEGDGYDDGRSFGFLRTKLFQAEDFSHATEVDNSIVARGERDHVFDRTVDFDGLLPDKQDPARTNVPGDSRLGDLIGTCPDDFHRKFHLKPLSSALLNHVLNLVVLP